MALAFPTPLADFYSRIEPFVTAVSPDLGEDMEINWNGRGELLTSDTGDRLWKMDLTLRADRYEALEGVKARLQVYRQAGRSFFIHAMPLFYPQADPDGLLLGQTLPTLSAVTGNMRDIRLSGLPANYELTEGDYLSFAYASGPTRYAFHQIVNSVNASSAGVTPNFEVVPEIRPGYSLGANVHLIRPFFKAIITPSTTRAGTSSGRFTRDLGFTIQQTLRE